MNRPLETGVKNTDNCPVCGLTMRKRRVTGWILTCPGPGHETSVFIEDPQPQAPGPKPSATLES